MLHKKLLILMACFGAIMVASTATAGSMHSHAHHAGVTHGAPMHPHVSKAVSPFEVKPGDKRLHCELLGHNPLLPCPHHKIPAEGKDNCYLSNECGGGPSPSFRSVGEYPRFLVPVASVEDDVQIAMAPMSPTVFYDPFYFHSLDRPPRAL